MAESSAKAEDKPASAVLTLQEWLKLLSGRGVDMRVAMTLAAKIYSSHKSKELLGGLTAQKLAPIIPDKDQRRTVLNAVKGIASGQTYVKKRTRDSDLLEPLAAAKEEQATSLEFNEITDPESLIPVTITTNRAPVKTAWAYTVALRMGFDVQEALSIAHVHVHISSLKHALMLGNILNPAETKEAEDELSELPGEIPFVPKANKAKGKGRARGREEVVETAIGSSQPWVGIMRSRPVIERPDGTWRAIQKGLPVEPSVAYLYITRAFKDYTGHVMGSLKLLADSYTGDELNRLGMHMYIAEQTSFSSQVGHH
ncbi:hypothetical protein BCR39DRAFT_138636 [Naematelia encephala]|uniref:Uncharacterized protein n=1 Tax=Naematelia encephala TaxID=71784 RepID=A0A1Y2BJJ9_9TREE|nr:hypothetical protein BCR39DRAFT_138636 [Naematelia encephala]